MDLGLLISEQIRDVITEELSNYKNEIFLGTVIETYDGRKATIRYNNKEIIFKFKNTIIPKGSNVHVIHPNGDEKNKFILEDIVTIDSAGKSLVYSVDGRTGDVLLDDIYVNKQDKVPTIKLISEDNTLILDGSFI